MAQKKKLLTVFITFVTLILVYVLVKENVKVTVKESMGKDNVVTVPLKIETHHNFICLVDNSVIYQTIEDNATTFYRYYIAVNKTEKLGSIDNYFLNGRSSTLIDGSLYFYVTTGTLESYENKLYCIDLKKNMLEQLSKNQNTGAVIPVNILNNNLLSLKSNLNKNANIGETFLTTYDPVTKGEKMVLEKEISYDSLTGAAILSIACFNNEIYVLTEMAKSGVSDNVIEIYNENFSLLRTIDIEETGEIAKKLGQAIIEFKVIDDFIFILNTSGDMILAKMLENDLEVALMGSNIDIASYYQEKSNPEYHILFERDSTNYYIFDKKNSQIINAAFNLEPNFLIRCVLADENGFLFVMKKDTKDRNDNSQSIYYLENTFLTAQTTGK